MKKKSTSSRKKFVWEHLWVVLSPFCIHRGQPLVVGLFVLSRLERVLFRLSSIDPHWLFATWQLHWLDILFSILKHLLFFASKQSSDRQIGDGIIEWQKSVSNMDQYDNVEASFIAELFPSFESLFWNRRISKPLHLQLYFKWSIFHRSDSWKWCGSVGNLEGFLLKHAFQDSTFQSCSKRSCDWRDSATTFRDSTCC